MRVYEAARKIVRDAVDEVRVRMGSDIQLKPRDFLKVHNRGGESLSALRQQDNPDHSQSAHHQLLPPLPARPPDQDLKHPSLEWVQLPRKEAPQPPGLRLSPESPWPCEGHIRG